MKCQRLAVANMCIITMCVGCGGGIGEVTRDASIECSGEATDNIEQLVQAVTESLARGEWNRSMQLAKVVSTNRDCTAEQVLSCLVALEEAALRDAGMVPATLRSGLLRHVPEGWRGPVRPDLAARMWHLYEGVNTEDDVFSTLSSIIVSVPEFFTTFATDSLPALTAESKVIIGLRVLEHSDKQANVPWDEMLAKWRGSGQEVEDMLLRAMLAAGSDAAVKRVEILFDELPIHRQSALIPFLRKRWERSGMVPQRLDAARDAFRKRTASVADVWAISVVGGEEDLPLMVSAVTGPLHEQFEGEGRLAVVGSAFHTYNTRLLKASPVSAAGIKRFLALDEEVQVAVILSLPPTPSAARPVWLLYDDKHITDPVRSSVLVWCSHAIGAYLGQQSVERAGVLLNIPGGAKEVHSRMREALSLRLSGTLLPRIGSVKLASGVDAYVSHLGMPRDLLGRGPYAQPTKEYELLHTWAMTLMDLVAWVRGVAETDARAQGELWFRRARDSIEDALDQTVDAEKKLAEIRRTHERSWDERLRSRFHKMDLERAAKRADLESGWRRNEQERRIF